MTNNKQVTILGFNSEDYKQAFIDWNAMIKRMWQNCMDVGRACKLVYYEQLVLHPESSVRLS